MAARRRRAKQKYAVNISLKAWDIAKAGAAIKLRVGTVAVCSALPKWDIRLERGEGEERIQANPLAQARRRFPEILLTHDVVLGRSMKTIRTATVFRPTTKRTSISEFTIACSILRRTAEELSDLKPRDRIDVQSLIWVVGDYKDGREEPRS